MGSSHRSPLLLLRLQPLLLLLLLLLGHISSAQQSSSLPLPSSPSSSLLAELQEDIAAEEREEAVLGCIEDNIDLALIQASITKEKIDDFKDDYTKVKYNMTFEDWSSSFPAEIDEAVMEVCNMDQECSTVLPSVPSATTPPPATDSDAAKTLEEILNYSLRFRFAYEQLVLDQSMKEDKFAKEMHDAYINHGQLVRLLENVQEVCGLPGDFSDIATLHGKLYVRTSDPHTDLRGFSTLRQSLRGLDLLESTFGQRLRALEEKAKIKLAVERLVERAVEEVENEKVEIEEEAVENIREEIEDETAMVEEEAVERLLKMATEEVENVMAEEQEEEEAVQRRNKKGKKKGKGGRGRSDKNGKNKKESKKRKRRRDYLD